MSLLSNNVQRFFLSTWYCSHRAEATDVANAVLDGTDGILLGAETLRGKYPVETVRTILDICRQAEKVFDHANHFEHLMQVKHRTPVSLVTLLGKPPCVIGNPKTVFVRTNCSSNLLPSMHIPSTTLRSAPLTCWGPV